MLIYLEHRTSTFISTTIVFKARVNVACVGTVARRLRKDDGGGYTVQPVLQVN